MARAASHADFPALARHRRSAAGRAWLKSLDTLVDECAAAWSLALGEPYGEATASLVLPAERRDGTSVVLKVQFPHRECRAEGDALRVWNGDGAVRLLDQDRARWVLLLERCSPGSPLSDEEPERALDALVDLLPRLWQPAGAPFATLGEEAARWIDTIARHRRTAQRRFGATAVDRALGLLAELPAGQGEQVLVHQDLHGGNVLAAARQPWLVIDPKPLVGEREFALAPVVRSPELGAGPRQLERRLHRLAGEFGLDRRRVLGWTLAQTVAWGASGEGPPGHADVVAWLDALW